MRNAIVLLLCLSMGCTQNNHLDSTVEVNCADSIVKSKCVEFDYAIRKQTVRYSNDYYVIQTTPFLGSVSGKYSVNVLVTHDLDTIVSKPINLDSLIRKIRKHNIHLNEIDATDLLDYEMQAVIPTNWVRGYNAYMIAKMSKANAPDIFIRFAIKVLTKDNRLWINGISYDNSEFEKQKKLRVTDN
ncbi:MAG: hypothetical protein ACI8SE_002189 [Bacteroidia bacterium]|jgi:hypothetical protein